MGCFAVPCDLSRYRPAHHNAAVLPSRSASSPHSRLSASLPRASLGAKATWWGREFMEIMRRLASSNGVRSGMDAGASRPLDRLVSSEAGVGTGAKASRSLDRLVSSVAGVGVSIGVDARASRPVCGFLASQRFSASRNLPITCKASAEVSTCLRLASDTTPRTMARTANGQFMTLSATNVIEATRSGKP